MRREARDQPINHVGIPDNSGQLRIPITSLRSLIDVRRSADDKTCIRSQLELLLRKEACDTHGHRLPLSVYMQQCGQQSRRVQQNITYLAVDINLFCAQGATLELAPPSEGEKGDVFIRLRVKLFRFET